MDKEFKQRIDTVNGLVLSRFEGRTIYWPTPMRPSLVAPVNPGSQPPQTLIIEYRFTAMFKEWHFSDGYVGLGFYYAVDQVDSR